MKDKFLKLSQMVLHLVSLGAILVAAWPLANVFWETPRFIGVDTSIFLFYVQDFAKNWRILPPGAWKHIWFEGMPRLLDTSWLNLYLIQPLVLWLGAFFAVKGFVALYFFLFLFFSYLLFYKLSKSFLLSLGLTIVSAYSGAVLLPAYSSGIILSFCSQAWFVATLFFLVGFLDSKKLRDLLLAAIALSLCLYTHAGIATLFALPAAIITLLMGSGNAIRLKAWGEKLKAILLFLITVGLIGLVEIVPDLVARLIEGGHGWLFAAFKAYPKTFSMLWEATPKALLFVFIATLVIAPFITGLKGKSRALPFWLILVYFLIFELGLYTAKNPLAAFIFPWRIFWLLPVSLGGIISSFWFAKDEMRSVSVWTRRILLLGFALMLSSVVLWSKEKTFYFLNLSNLGQERFVSLDDFHKIGIEGESLVDINDTNYRMYSFSQGYNLLWGMFIPIPEARGTFHYMTENNADWFAWLDAVVSHQNLEEDNIPREVARRQSLWLADWYAIRYFYSPPGIPGQLANFFWEDFPVEAKSRDSNPVLFRIPKKAISPIVGLTDSPTIGFVGTKDAYSYFLRLLGVLNLNSRYIVPIYLGETPEKIDQKALSDLDSLFFYDYRQYNKESYLKSWGAIEDFVKQGGVVFLETGNEAPEKYGVELSSVFPVKKILKGKLSSNWEVNGSLVDKIDFSSLSPLIYEGEKWSVTYTEHQELTEGSEVLLEIAGKPVIVAKQMGKGNVVWSGVNLVYRPHYYSENAIVESSLLKEFIDYGLDLEHKRGNFIVDRPTSEKVTVKGVGTKGVLFKENNYGGWRAVAKADNKKYGLPIYSAGTYFMYSKLPDEFQGEEVEVIYEYKGKWENWVSFWISIASFLAVTFIIIKYRNITTDRIKISIPGASLFKKLGRWWESEEV